MNLTEAEIMKGFRKTVVKYNQNEGTLMDLVLTTFCVLIAMALLSCICCICMRVSDMRLKAYIRGIAKKKGLSVDLDKLDSKHTCSSPHARENCTIMVPDVGIIL